MTPPKGTLLWSRFTSTRNTNMNCRAKASKVDGRERPALHSDSHVQKSKAIRSKFCVCRNVDSKQPSAIYFWLLWNSLCFAEKSGVRRGRRGGFPRRLSTGAAFLLLVPTTDVCQPPECTERRCLWASECRMWAPHQVGPVRQRSRA